MNTLFLAVACFGAAVFVAGCWRILDDRGRARREPKELTAADEAIAIERARERYRERIADVERHFQEQRGEK